jgi:hypothetical protein
MLKMCKLHLEIMSYTSVSKTASIFKYVYKENSSPLPHAPPFCGHENVE